MCLYKPLTPAIPAIPAFLNPSASPSQPKHSFFLCFIISASAAVIADFDPGLYTSLANLTRGSLSQ